MGQPGAGHSASPASECIGGEERTRGSEPSQYPEEKDSNSDSPSSGERKGISLNRWDVIGRGRCSSGVVGTRRPCLDKVGELQSWGLAEAGRTAVP